MMTNNPNFKPFSQIPLLPEEKKLMEDSGEEKLPGAPKSAEDSALLAVPQLSKVLEDTATFNFNPARAKRSEQRTQLEAIGKGWAENPDAMVEYFAALHFAEEMPGQAVKTKELEAKIIENFERCLAETKLTGEESMGKLLRLAAKDELYGDMAKRILRHHWSKINSPKEVVNYLYNLGLACMHEQDRETFLYGLQSLCFDSDITSDGDKQYRFFMEAMYDTDELFLRQQEIDAVINTFGEKFTPASERHFARTAVPHLRQSSWKELVDHYYMQSPIRAREKTDYFKKTSAGIVPISELETKKWPYSSFIFHPGPLRKAHNKRLEQETENFFSLKIPPNGASVLIRADNQDSLNQTIGSDLKKVQNPIVLTDSSDTRLLLYLRPNFSPEQKEALAACNSGLQREILAERQYGISPRGDRMLTTDTTLNNTLGLESITFEHTEPKPTLKATLQVGKCAFVFKVEPDLAVKPFEGEDFNFPFQQRAFFDYIILSHLKELQCTERVIPGNIEKRSGVNPTERQQEFISRRAHIRLLPLNHEPDPDLVQKALSEQGWNLAEMARRKNVFPRKYTYIPATEVRLHSQSPIISRAPHAFDKLNEIMAKNTAEPQAMQ